VRRACCDAYDGALCSGLSNHLGDDEEAEEENNDVLVHGHKKRKVAFMPSLGEYSHSKGHRIEIHFLYKIVMVTLDPRTGRLNLKDTGDLTATGRGPWFAALSERLVENPALLLDTLVGLQLNMKSISASSTLAQPCHFLTDHHRSRTAEGAIP